jgi:hypothetical protein
VYLYRNMIRPAFAIGLVLVGCLAARAQSGGLAPVNQYSSFIPTARAVLSAGTSTSNVAIGAGQVAWICNQSIDTDAFVALGNASVTVTVANGFPVLFRQCVSLQRGGAVKLAAIVATGTAALVIATGSGRP